MHWGIKLKVMLIAAALTCFVFGGIDLLCFRRRFGR